MDGIAKMDGMAEKAKAFVEAAIKGAVPEPWGQPDMGILRPARRSPPAFPIDILGPEWGQWIIEASDAAAAPPDYVVAPLLASASALIGNARWAQATPGWREPPHLWVGVVGDSGSSKSPAADCLMRDILPEIEREMAREFPDEHARWLTEAEMQKAKIEQWEKDVRAANKAGTPPPDSPGSALRPEPQSPRLRQMDVTIERVASILVGSPKGVLMVRDELAGWFNGLNAYNESGRAFWLEAYGGRSHRVERQKHPVPIDVPRLAVALTGGTQPERLAEMFREADDGLLARMIWAWPDPKKFRLSRKAPNVQFAISALDRQMTDAMPDRPAAPIYMPLSDGAVSGIEGFGGKMQVMQQRAGGLLRSAYGKARGVALRLSLNIELLRWAASSTSGDNPPDVISEASLTAACSLVEDYFLPMAERVYGDAASTEPERNAMTLAKWIMHKAPSEVHVRTLQREERLPGLSSAETIRAAAAVLVEAGWLRNPLPSTQQGRSRVAYPVNPEISGGLQ